MSRCCELPDEGLATLRARQGRVLWAVLAINAGMFLLEGGAGILGRSTSLLADSLDMLGDALVYGVSLYALHRSERWRAGAALIKGLVMGALAAGVALEAGAKVLRGLVPVPEVMGAMGVLALLANLTCLGLLLRHRGDDLNMRSVWLCSRNDVLANGAVLAAAGGVAFTGGAWPDVAVGLAIAGLFLRSAVGVVRDSARALR